MRRVSRWAGLAAVPLVVGGLVWWGLQAPQESAAPRPLARDHQRCQPIAGASSTTPERGPVAAGPWQVSVAGASVTRSLPATESGSYRAEPGRAFLVVDLELRREQGDRGEVEVRSASVLVTCQDGMAITPWGWQVEGGFCALCTLNIGVQAPTTRISFALKLDEGWVHQPFEIRYDGAGPLRVVVPAA
jgi:hypothetical protein